MVDSSLSPCVDQGWIMSTLCIFDMAGLYLISMHAGNPFPWSYYDLPPLGFTLVSHNEIRDITAELMAWSCMSWYCCWVPTKLWTTDRWKYNCIIPATNNRQDNAKYDKPQTPGFWGCRQSAFLMWVPRVFTQMHQPIATPVCWFI